jgi:hypothetical protein
VLDAVDWRDAQRLSPKAEPEKIERACVELAKGVRIAETARLTGLGAGTFTDRLLRKRFDQVE